MRVCVYPADPGYQQYLAARPVVVFLDGVKVERAVMADEESGEVANVATDAQGRIIVDNDTPRLVLRTGKVQIVPFGHAL